MRKILIVGSGQSGLQLALSLQAEGYDVTVMSARTPEEIRGGRVMSTQAMFGPALQVERDRGLNLWEDQAPQIGSLYVSVAGPPGVAALQIPAPFNEFVQSVDQRVKMAGWLELFAQRGGNVVYHPVMTSDLEGLVRLYDLTIIAAGKGELVELFDRDATRSPYPAPQRALAVIYVHGVKPLASHPATHVGINATPGIGELFTIPGYTTSGPCDILFFEGVPGGPLDRFGDRPDTQAHLARTLDLMREYIPWEYERCTEVEPTDARSTLTGAYAPVVRHPVGSLSGSAFVLGMADVVVANDPICGQGSNNACHCARIYLDSILERGRQPFDPDWMQRTFDAYWDYAQWPTAFSNA
ncbi:MAG TPA: styrene monooxygenase/indole monooxygenase family protein, partial [Streptosporangiaceae bacterium]|nr:styrene monooxygenase/indole monooxygenase family protein [Streptosporangiaceae bacterium]